MMPTFYKVKQGDHLYKIAVRFGFTDYRVIWEHPRNAPVRSKRPNPNVLFPGDMLFIPDKQEKTLQRPTSQEHCFVIPRKTIQLRIILLDWEANPMADLPCTLKVEDQFKQTTTDWNGQIEMQIPASAEFAALFVQNDVIAVKIGHLDPVEEVSGQQARLNNLGYDAGDAMDRADIRMRSAVEEFQCDNNLPVFGTCDAQTQCKLKEVHGC